ncbi:MAG: hypothetical protein WCI18_11830 [Pseudomonadota bacterium]
MQNIPYFVDLLSDRLDRLEKVVVGDDVSSLQEIIFLERAAFDSLQRSMSDVSQTYTPAEIEPLYEKVMSLTRLAEKKISELETKLKQVRTVNGKIKKFAAAEKVDGFVSKSV